MTAAAISRRLAGYNRRSAIALVVILLLCMAIAIGLGHQPALLDLLHRRKSPPLSPSRRMVLPRSFTPEL